MSFSDLNEEKKNKLSQDIKEVAVALGSVNTLLNMVEDMRKDKPSPLVRKETIFSFNGGGLKWNKFIYKDTFDLLVNTIIREDKNGDIFEGVKEKARKNILNMLKTIKPIVITMKPKNQKTASGFSMGILDENEKISLLFKVIFIYNIDFAKKALKWEIKEA